MTREYASAIGSGTPGGRVGLLASVLTDASGLRVVDELELGEVTYLAHHPSASVIYATMETAEGSELVSVSVDGDLRLRVLSRVPCGAGPTSHVMVTSDGRFVVVGGYGTSSITSFAVDDDGSATREASTLTFEGSGPRTDRQERSHPHQVVESHGALLVPDLGSDRIHQVSLGEHGELELMTSVSVAPGTGPRHLLKHRGLLLVVGELSGELLWTRDFKGDWSSARSSLSDDPECAPSAIGLLDDSTLLLANRSPGTISVWDLDGDEPHLTAEVDSGPTWPRDFRRRGEFVIVANSRDSQLCAVSVREDGGDIIWRAEWDHPTCIVPLEK